MYYRLTPITLSTQMGDHGVESPVPRRPVLLLRVLLQDDVRESQHQEDVLRDSVQ